MRIGCPLSRVSATACLQPVVSRHDRLTVPSWVVHNFLWCKACTILQEKLKIDGPDDVPHPTPPGGTVINATAMTLGIQHGEMKQLVRHGTCMKMFCQKSTCCC
jgi:hypothetical protein